MTARTALKHVGAKTSLRRESPERENMHDETVIRSLGGPILELNNVRVTSATAGTLGITSPMP